MRAKRLGLQQIFLWTVDTVFTSACLNKKSFFASFDVALTYGSKEFRLFSYAVRSCLPADVFTKKLRSSFMLNAWFISITWQGSCCCFSGTYLTAQDQNCVKTGITCQKSNNTSKYACKRHSINVAWDLFFRRSQKAPKPSPRRLRSNDKLKRNDFHEICRIAWTAAGIAITDQARAPLMTTPQAVNRHHEK